ncbi:MAG: hypothetical protein WDW38_007425 [Sanguina aurantia]
MPVLGRRKREQPLQVRNNKESPSHSANESGVQELGAAPFQTHTEDQPVAQHHCEYSENISRTTHRASASHQQTRRPR